MFFPVDNWDKGGGILKYKYCVCTVHIMQLPGREKWKINVIRISGFLNQKLGPTLSNSDIWESLKRSKTLQLVDNAVC